jgi:adenylate cyclase
VSTEALAADPDARDSEPGGRKRKLAAAYAYTGRDAEARRALAVANADWPFDTVRGHFPDDINPVFSAQVRNYQDGLRRAGERDHAEEAADFRISADTTLRPDLVGYTPATTPAAPTIRTAELPAFIAERKPVIIDSMMYFWGRSIPGAVGLKNAGVGGTTSDGAQERLGRKMAELTGGDLNRPIVTVGWNSERFDGRNLALRLVALGYTNISWYRGGREAWEAAGLPETTIDIEEW